MTQFEVMNFENILVRDSYWAEWEDDDEEPP